jgi:hypothetical protein
MDGRLIERPDDIPRDPPDREAELLERPRWDADP